MACQGSSSIVTFERDVPVVTFLVTSDGTPFRFYNYDPQLHIIDPGGNHIAQFSLIPLRDGVLAFDSSSDEGVAAFYEEIYKLKQDVGYRAQIFLEATPVTWDRIGLYDIIDPYWLDHVPALTDVPGWFSGELRQTQTVLTTFPWIIREAFKLRGN